jgi:flagellar biosynthetic protein FlhB
VAGRQERTEEPTSRRRNQARREGQVARSPELGVWASLLAGSLLVPLTVSSCARLERQLLARAAGVIARPDQAAALRLLGQALAGAAAALVPLLAGLAALGVAVNLAQVGLKPSAAALKPKLSRLAPGGALKRLVSPASLWEVGKSLVKLLLLGELARRQVAAVVPRLAGGLPLAGIVAVTAPAVLRFVRSVALAGLLLAAVDYALARWRWKRGLRMTKQEVKDEHRQSEGDPAVKGTIRRRMLTLSRQRMIAAVASADAVVVNPTHYAVALRYDRAGAGAPRVVAKGVDAIAARIREEADRHRVPLVADPPLARTLYATCELDDEVPPQLYEAVARLLAFIFAIKARGTPLPGTHTLPPR